MSIFFTYCKREPCSLEKKGDGFRVSTGDLNIFVHYQIIFCIVGVVTEAFAQIDFPCRIDPKFNFGEDP